MRTACASVRRRPPAADPRPPATGRAEPAPGTLLVEGIGRLDTAAIAALIRRNAALLTARESNRRALVAARRHLDSGRGNPHLAICHLARLKAARLRIAAELKANREEAHRRLPPPSRI